MSTDSSTGPLVRAAGKRRADDDNAGEPATERDGKRVCGDRHSFPSEMAVTKAAIKDDPVMAVCHLAIDPPTHPLHDFHTKTILDALEKHGEGSEGLERFIQLMLDMGKEHGTAETAKASLAKLRQTWSIRQIKKTVAHITDEETLIQVVVGLLKAVPDMNDAAALAVLNKTSAEFGEHAKKTGSVPSTINPSLPPSINGVTPAASRDNADNVVDDTVLAWRAARELSVGLAKVKIEPGLEAPAEPALPSSSGTSSKQTAFQFGQPSLGGQLHKITKPAINVPQSANSIGVEGLGGKTGAAWVNDPHGEGSALPQQLPIKQWDLPVSPKEGVYLDGAQLPRKQRNEVCQEIFGPYGFVRMVKTRYQGQKSDPGPIFVELDAEKATHPVAGLIKSGIHIKAKKAKKGKGGRNAVDVTVKSLDQVTHNAFVGGGDTASAADVIIAIATMIETPFALQVADKKASLLVVFAEKLRTSAFKVQIFRGGQNRTIRFRAIDLVPCGACVHPHPASFLCTDLSLAPRPDFAIPTYQTGILADIHKKLKNADKKAVKIEEK